MTKFSKYKDFTVRQHLKRSQYQRHILKFFFSNQKIEKKLQFKIMLKIQRIHNKVFGNRFKNRCMFSTKVRAVSRLTNLTKTTFRSNLMWGKVMGFKKASW